MSSLASFRALASSAQISCRPGGRLQSSSRCLACLRTPSQLHLPCVRGPGAASAVGNLYPGSSHLGQRSHESRVIRDKGARAGLGLALPPLTPEERGLERETQQGCCGRGWGQEKEFVSVQCRTSVIRPALPIKPPGRQEWGGGSESEGPSMGVQKPRRCMRRETPQLWVVWRWGKEAQRSAVPTECPVDCPLPLEPKVTCWQGVEQSKGQRGICGH